MPPSTFKLCFSWFLLARIVPGRRIQSSPDSTAQVLDQDAPRTLHTAQRSRPLAELKVSNANSVQPWRSLTLLFSALDPSVALVSFFGSRSSVSRSTPRRKHPVMNAQEIKLYTNQMCPFAQRVWIALEASGLPFEKTEVNLYGGTGFNKAALKQVEREGGLSPKGYIPVMSIGDEVIRESSVLVERVAQLSAETSGASSLQPEQPEVAEELVRCCNELPTRPSSPQLDELMRKADAQLEKTQFLAGDKFSIADACLLPFLQRVEDDGGIKGTNLESYMRRARKLAAFSKTIASSYWWWW